MEQFECGGRGHLVGAGSWLIVRHLRALVDRANLEHPAGIKAAARTRSDYLFGMFTSEKRSPKTHT